MPRLHVPNHLGAPTLERNAVPVSYLAGGWTNPFEKYARQIGSSPQVTVKIKHIWNHHLVIVWLVNGFNEALLRETNGFFGGRSVTLEGPMVFLGGGVLRWEGSGWLAIVISRGNPEQLVSKLMLDDFQPFSHVKIGKNPFETTIFFNK